MKKTKFLIILSSFLLIPVVALVYAVFIEPYYFEIKEVNLESPDILPSFDGKRIVFVADIHNGEYFSRAQVTDLVNRINALKPDMVILGGDYASRGFSNTSIAFEELKRLQAPLGKYGVLGNHDYWEGGQEALRAMNASGVTSLNNRGVWIYSDGERIRLGGVSDLWHGAPDPIPTIVEVNQSDYVILVSHNPDYAEELGTSLADIVLAGHTHGGQVTVFGLWMPYMPSDYGQKYKGGFAQTAYTTVYVTRGVGMTFLPIRFFARPEITVLTLKRVQIS
ncbi:MAG: metallophosphoesterase [Candidatus Altiarchaeia archaeon]